MATPTIDQFLSGISRIVREQNGLQLQDYLVVEPPYAPLYQTMIGEVRRSFAKGNEEALENKCASKIPEAQGGGEVASWSAFIKFMVQYLSFLRDVDTQNLLDTYNLLNELVQKSISALGHATFGVLVLPTVIAYSRMLARLAIGLDKQPHLIAHLTKQSTDEGGARETLPERAANIMRQAFVTCLNDRSGDAAGLRDGRPTGKKAGIYKIANLCLKVLFQCRKIRNAEQMFINIDNQAPPLSAYPRSERVTYLYYLGRFYYASNHFWRAQLVLQRAYNECHGQCPKQKRLILIYLVASNIILGRFPSQNLLQRPEAAGLADAFLPLCYAIRNGDLASFYQMFQLDELNPQTQWFLKFRICLQLRNRCEVLIWRTLFRRTFQLEGFIPPASADSRIRTAATLNLLDVLKLARSLTNKGSSTIGYRDPDLDDYDQDSTDLDTTEIESVASSLLAQGLLNGFLSHRQLRFAVTGARAKNADPLVAGFPNIWQTIASRCDDSVPGWVKDRKPFGGGAFGAGQVVNLSGIARPAGFAP